MNNTNIRNIGGADELDKFAMENCLKLENTQTAAAKAAAQGKVDNAMKIYTCMTCGKKYDSFQALGGHRASHKKLKLPGDATSPVPPRPKTHACSICGAEFPVGQALGGHMRCHRLVTGAGSGNGSTITTEVSVKEEAVENEKKRKIDDVSDGEVGNFRSISKRVCLDLTLGFVRFAAEKKVEKKDEGVEIEKGEVLKSVMKKMKRKIF